MITGGEYEMQAGYNDMRLKGILTDIILKPIPADEANDTNELRAHASLLVATIPHFREICHWEGKSEYYFEGTFFAAKKVLGTRI
jgi:hypothetical protein